MIEIHKEVEKTQEKGLQDLSKGKIEKISELFIQAFNKCPRRGIHSTENRSVSDRKRPDFFRSCFQELPTARQRNPRCVDQEKFHPQFRAEVPVAGRTSDRETFRQRAP